MNCEAKWSDSLYTNNPSDKNTIYEKQIIYTGKYNATHRYIDKFNQTCETERYKAEEMGHLYCNFWQYFQRLVDLITHIEN